MKEFKTKYDHLEVEKGKYAYWMEKGYFKSGDKTKEPFTIVIPPPNVTGKLHAGHAWDTTLQDIIIRRKRMQGYDALWLPGMDHAGIATQAKIEERLRNEGVSRYDLGREKFLEVAWEWKKEYSNYIREQWEALGLSLDYSKERFTLDEGLNKAVNHVFITLYNKGIIYQGERIINWDPKAKTALSNIEVEHKETQGAFYHLLYKLTDCDEYLDIATTRPETMFGDTAIMVHPDDERYKKYVGKKVIIPLTDMVVPIIADEYVDMEFGTGVVKVTPAHDPNDFMVGRKHGLEMPLCMNDDGTMNSRAGIYDKMDRFDCRKQLISDLQKANLCPKIEPIMHQVGYSERTHVVVEPRLSKQWFVKMKPLANQALEKSTVSFVPERFEKNWSIWMENIQDWCISRQLWWGHRVPAWYKDSEVLVQVESPGEGWKQDEDVLDTWFSSALWPFSTLGWPENTEDFKRYYPTDCLVTGYDIIPFWVSRMIFQGIEFTGESPFKTCLIHGLIRDSQGRKMSKSLGNGIDPLQIGKEYGTDTLRYFISTNGAPGQDLRYEEEKILSSWNYINKIWNISRYIVMNLDSDCVYTENFSELNATAKWILMKLDQTIKEADEAFEKYDFGVAAKAIYNFVWDDFASWYVELSKVDIKNAKKTTQEVLLYVLTSVLKLLHPFMPFVTEEIYQMIPHKEEALIIASWPKQLNISDDEAKKKVETTIELITAIRTMRHNANKGNSIALDMDIVTEINLEECREYFVRFTNPNNLNLGTIPPLYEASTSILTNASVYIPMASLINIEEEIKKLTDAKAKIEGELNRSRGMLNNEKFVSKAPKEKIEQEKNKLVEYENQYKNILDQLTKFNK